MTIKPTKDYILLTVDKKKEEVSAGGIYLPEKASSEPQCGIVAFKEWYSSNDPLHTGVKVWYKKWAGESINYNGTDYLLVHIKDILAYEGGE